VAQYVYTMHRVGKVVPPKRHILKNISLSFFPGAKIGVLGLNGSGKSTLLRIMAGIDTDIEGEARPQQGIKIGYLPQEPQLNLEHTVRESVEEALAEVVGALKRLDEVYALYAEEGADFDKLAAEQGRLEEIIQAHDGHNLNTQLERAADALRLPEWDAKIANLSGGERRRVALCRLLLEKPDMLLLDEPTNHLDAESVAWLERFLHDFEGTVVAITHDRYFLDNVAGWILELDRGEGIPWEGNYSSWLEQKDARLAQEASSEAARRKSIEKELEWVRQGAKGRQSKGKARLARFEELNSTEYQKRNETNELFIPPGARLGDKVVEVSNLRKSYGDRVLIDDLSFAVPKGAIVGIIGPNGAGKSTLFRMMSGQEQPDSGSIVLGDTVKLASVDQFRDSMDNSKPFGKKSPAARTSCVSATPKCQAELTSVALTSKASIRASAWANCPAVSAVVCTWPSCCRLAATYCCSTNRPTTWILKPCARWKTPCWSSRAARWLSRTTVGSSTVLLPTFWITRMKVTSSSSKVTSPNTKSTRNVRWAPKRLSRTVSSTRESPSNPKGAACGAFFYSRASSRA
jgi:energy-dependent translational throttle protein EttA